MAPLAKLGRKWVGGAVRTAIRPFGLTTIALQSLSSRYIDCDETIANASRKKMTVPEYVAELWDEKGAVESVVERLSRSGALQKTGRVVEIGPGTGRFLEQIAPRVAAAAYETYETSEAWSNYLVDKYGVLRRTPDGETLQETASESCGLVQAHCVFVYLPVTIAFHYFDDMIRVCQPGGFVVFDCFPDQLCDTEMIGKWVKGTHRWQVVLPGAALMTFFTSRGMSLVDQFDNNRMIVGTSRYFVFQKPGVDAGLA